MTPSWHDQKEVLKFIGQTLTVVVDRPLGSAHPWHGFVYPVNYGFVADVLGGDGEAQDAYVIGVHEPLQQFTGKCIAVILRQDDVEAKLVISAGQNLFTSDEIMELVAFQEQFFRSTIITAEDI